jgi:hypothetical protein
VIELVLERASNSARESQLIEALTADGYAPGAKKV